MYQIHGSQKSWDYTIAWKRLKSVTLKDYKWPDMLGMIKPFHAVIFCNATQKPIG